MLPTHEIKYGRIDAHSHSRALAVEAVAHKTQSGCRAPILASRSRNTHSSVIRSAADGFSARLIRFVFEPGHLPQSAQQLRAMATAAAFLPAARLIFSHIFLMRSSAANGSPGGLLQHPAQVARAGLADVSLPLFAARGKHARRQAGIAADGLA